MYIEDLHPLTDAPAQARQLAVGWLEQGRPHAMGQVAPEVVEALRALSVNAWAAAESLGVHFCSLCAPGPAAVGRRELYIPGAGCVYVAPELLVHYIVDHGYAPPQEFCAAVLACPAMGSPAYFAALERALPVNRTRAWS
jgi:hypothetical protein